MKTWQEATYKDIEKLTRNKTIILSLGTIEAHGAHLPLGTDAFIARKFASNVAEKTNSILGPSLLFGPCETLLNFVGTINISEKTLFVLLKDILDSIFHHGFKRVFIINGHGGNVIVLEDICTHYKKNKVGVKVFFKSWYNVKFAENLRKSDKTYKGDHADRLETEMMFAINKSLVRFDLAVDDLIKWPLNWEQLDDYSQLMKNAVDGFPSRASLAKSGKIYKMILEELIKELKLNMPSFKKKELESSRGNRENFLVLEQKKYSCGNCGAENMGGRYNNHCSNCLWSKHVDDKIPGDRNSNCQSLMKPVTVTQKGGKWRIRHQCIECRKKTWVDSATKDNFDILIQLSTDGCC